MFLLNSVYLLLQLVFLVNNVYGTFNPNEICELVPNGSKLNDPTACNKWIECIEHAAYSFSCNENQFYARNSGTCVPAGSIKCLSTDPCAALEQGTGFAKDPNSCTTYYYCKNYVATQGFCAEGLQYNPETFVCSSTYECKLERNPLDICNIVPNGVFIKDAENCSNYKLCWNDELITGNCLTNFYFNADRGVCSQFRSESCNKDLLANIPHNCERAGQFISDNETCNGYYYCQAKQNDQFELIPGTCKVGRFFSAENDGLCVLRTNLSCTYDRCAGYGYKNIQLANLYNDNCRGFAVCNQGKQIAQGMCPDDQYFDEIKQHCTTDLISYVACTTTTTTTTTTTIENDNMN